MSAIADRAFLSESLIEERKAPRPRRDTMARARDWLASPSHIVLLAMVPLLLWFLVIPAVQFLFFHAVWRGADRDSCLAENAGHVVGACWPYVAAKWSQFIYGFYPAEARWRVNLTFILAAALLAPLLIPRLPAKRLNAALFFLAFPMVAFFLLRGGGLNGFALTWCAGFLESADQGLARAGQSLLALSHSPGSAGVTAVLVRGVGGLAVIAGHVLHFVLTPLMMLRDFVQGTGQALWTDFLFTAVVIVLFLGWRAGLRAAVSAVVSFLAIAAVIRGMALDAGGLALIDTRLWGGLLVTLVIAVTGIVVSIPIGITLALGRRSSLPLIRFCAIVFIEFWRGVPLITVLFFATYMLPLFLPGHFSIDGLLRALIGVAIFAGAYQAEVIRGDWRQSQPVRARRQARSACPGSGPHS